MSSNPGNFKISQSGDNPIRKLTDSEIHFMKIIEKQNFERATKLKRIRKNNILTGGLLGCGVLGIYLYSMLAVKQERFLDDFEPPKTVSTD